MKFSHHLHTAIMEVGGKKGDVSLIHSGNKWQRNRVVKGPLTLVAPTTETAAARPQ